MVNFQNVHVSMAHAMLVPKATECVTQTRDVKGSTWEITARRRVFHVPLLLAVTTAMRMLNV